jgi:hypothetical protein
VWAGPDPATYFVPVTVSCLACLASMFLGPMAFAAEANVARPGEPRASKRSPIALGVLADAGVPDGGNLALAVRPAHWLRLHAGGGYNTVSVGFRGGATWSPFGTGPSLSLEGGHYADGDANGIVHRFVHSDAAWGPLFRRVSYSYVNTQLGLELGRRSLQFYVHAGVSYVRAVVHDAQSALDSIAPPGGGGTSVRITQDPIVHIWLPSVKLGMVVYFGGGT